VLLASEAGRQVDNMLRYSAAGTPSEVAEYLGGFVRHTGADELMVLHQSPLVEDRLRSVVPARRSDGGRRRQDGSGLDRVAAPHEPWSRPETIRCDPRALSQRGQLRPHHDGWTRGDIRAIVPNPQSVPAMTFSRPTRAQNCMIRCATS